LKDKMHFKPGIRTKTIHQTGITFGSLLGLNIGYVMDLLVDTLDLTIVRPTVAIRDMLQDQADSLQKKSGK